MERTVNSKKFKRLCAQYEKRKRDRELKEQVSNVGSTDTVEQRKGRGRDRHCRDHRLLLMCRMKCVD